MPPKLQALFSSRRFWAAIIQKTRREPPTSFVLPLFLIIAMSTMAMAQNVVALDLGEAKPGRYPVMIAIEDGGRVTITPLTVLTITGDPIPPGGGDDGNDGNDGLSPFAIQVSNWAKTTGDGETAAKLAVVYGWVADELEKGIMNGPDALKVISSTTDRFTSGGFAIEWRVFRDKLSDELASLARQGKLSSDEDYLKALRQIHDGLENSTNTAISPEAILKIIQTVVEIMRLLGIIK